MRNCSAALLAAPIASGDPGGKSRLVCPGFAKVYVRPRIVGTFADGIGPNVHWVGIKLVSLHRQSGEQCNHDAPGNSRRPA